MYDSSLHKTPEVKKLSAEMNYSDLTKIFKIKHIWRFHTVRRLILSIWRRSKTRLVLFAHGNLVAIEQSRLISLNRQKCLILIIFCGCCTSFQPMLHQRFCAQTSRREVPGSIPGRNCRLKHSEFSVIFDETCINTC